MDKKLEMQVLKDTHIDLAPGVQTNGVSCVVGKGTSFESMAMALTSVHMMVKCSQWWYGDMFNQGQAVIGERMDQIVGMIRISFKSWKHYGYMATKFPPKDRFMELEFGHHEKVAGLERAKQKRYLQKAVDNDWTVSEFANYVRMEEGANKKSGETNKDNYVYDNYVMAKIIGDVSPDSVSEAMVDGIEIPLDTLMSLGISPIANEDCVYIIAVKEKRAEGIEEAGTVTDQETVVPEPAVDYSKMSPAKLADEVWPWVQEIGYLSVSMLGNKYKVGHLAAMKVVEVLQKQAFIGEIEEDGSGHYPVTKTQQKNAPAFA